MIVTKRESMVSLIHDTSPILRHRRRRVCGYQSRVGGHGTRAGRRQSIAMGAQSIGSEVAAAVILTTLTVTHNRYLVEAPGKGWAHGVRGIR